jgi:hypothetical protein
MFTQLFCLQRRHMGHTHVGTWGLANSIPSFFKTPVSENPLQQLFLPQSGKGKRGYLLTIFVPTLSNLCRNLLNLLDSAILPVSISPIISKGMLNVGCRYKTGI